MRQRFQATPVWLRAVIGTAGAIALLGVAFLVGFSIADDADQVSELQAELRNADGDYDLAQDDIADLEEEVGSLRGQLRAERSLDGETPVSDTSATYDTDFPWMGAGKVGYLTMRPIEFSGSDGTWTLTIEAKNEGDVPEDPFCGDAGAALADSAGRTYTGDSVLAGNTDNCGDSLQPGLTGTYKSAFELPPDAEPVAVAIYGDFYQESKAKLWALPGQ